MHSSAWLVQRCKWRWIISDFFHLTMCLCGTRWSSSFSQRCGEMMVLPSVPIEMGDWSVFATPHDMVKSNLWSYSQHGTCVQLCVLSTKSYLIILQEVASDPASLCYEDEEGWSHERVYITTCVSGSLLYRSYFLQYEKWDRIMCIFYIDRLMFGAGRVFEMEDRCVNRDRW